MTNVKRYEFIEASYGEPPYMDELENGDYVKWEDYERLQAELKSAGEVIAYQKGKIEGLQGQLRANHEPSSSQPSLGQQPQGSASQIPSARGDIAGSGPPNGPHRHTFAWAGHHSISGNSIYRCECGESKVI